MASSSPELRHTTERAAGATTSGPLVSCIMIFLDAEAFIQEAIQSI
jgi:hypothetical protein